MAIERKQGLSLIIDGLHKIEHWENEFIQEVCVFVKHLRVPVGPSTTKVLLTSGPRDDIKEILSGLPCIEYDSERKGSIVSYLILNIYVPTHTPTLPVGQPADQ
jgi:hypothetical protein